MNKITFEGKVYTKRKNGYYRRLSMGKDYFLHRDVWKSVNGQIPKGFHIHHIDGDRGNNAIENLACLSNKEHCSLHNSESTRLEDAHKKLAELRKDPSFFEASKPKRVTACKKHWESIEERALVCRECGKTYFTRQTRKANGFCNQNCRQKNRNKSGIDNEKRVCVICGNEFLSNKYNKTTTCSRKCQGFLAGRTRILTLKGKDV
jgi:hypothetical protein